MELSPELKMKQKANTILRALLGNEELIIRWWNSSNKAFDGDLPDELWQTNAGRVKVYNYLLDQMESPH